MNRRRALIVRVADLEDLIESAGPALPGWLRRFLRHGQPRRLDSAAGGTDLAFDRALPVAPLTRRLDCPNDPGDMADCWLRADPIGLRPDIRAVWVFPGRADQPSTVEPLLQALFDEAGYRFELPDARRGYLKLPARPDCRFVPPEQTAGKSLDDLLPEGPDAAVWRRLGNEVQMVLHQASQQQEVGFQGLWFWGAGSLAEVADARPQIDWLASDDSALRAAAEWQAMPQVTVDSLARHHLPEGPGLVSWSATARLDAEANLVALGQFLAPALGQLRWGRLARLSLAGREAVHTLAPGQLWWPPRP